MHDCMVELVKREPRDYQHMYVLRIEGEIAFLKIILNIHFRAITFAQVQQKKAARCRVV